MNDHQGLRRAVSDVSFEVDKIITTDVNVAAKMNEIEEAECECCGHSEDCTPAYVGHIKDFYCGKWVCGLCSEAVKEHMNKAPRTPMEEAMDAHMAMCKNFNRTTRLNPKLSLAGTMRDIARRSSQHRISKNMPTSIIEGTNSSNPRINDDIATPINE